MASREATPADIPADSRRSFRLSRGDVLLPALVVLLLVVFSVASDKFLTADNLTNISRQSVYLLLVALGQMLILICGQLDLSVGATVSLASIVTAKALVTSGVTSPVSAVAIGVAAGLVTGAIVGLFNGLFVAVLRAPAFMVTLGTTSVATAIGLMITKGVPVSGLPDAFTDTLGSGRLLGVPVPILVAVVVVAGLAVFLRWTVSGRSMYAVGGNATAARFAGIMTGRVTMLGFVLCSLLAALSGVMLAARVGSGEVSLGGTYVLLSIAAAVLGGTSLFGGEGRVLYVVLGVLFIGILNNGMNLLQIPSYTQELALGLVLIFAVLGEAAHEKRYRS